MKTSLNGKSPYPSKFKAMAKRISAVQPNGEILVLEVTPETTGRLLKQQIKDGQHWDELTRCTTSVEIIVGENHFLANDAKVLDAGIAEDTVFTVVFKPNKVICSNKDTITSLGGMVDLQLLLVVEIPHDETQICESAFNRCGTLAHLIIPDSVTRIEDGAFRCSSSLVNLTIPDSVTHIGDAAFADCSALVNLTIPESVTRIEDDAFMGCASLVNLTILSSVEHIGGYAFADCISLVNLTIPDSVTRIEDGAFADCSSLVNLILPDSVIYIGTSAFAGCSALATLSIPDSVTHIGDGAFDGCRSLLLRVSISESKFEMHKLQGCKRIMAKECRCQESCDYSWFLKGWVCPQQWRQAC